MPYIPAVNVCQAELVYNWSSSVVENVLHFKPSTLLDVTLMAELGAHLVTLAPCAHSGTWRPFWR